ncbi:fimbrial protein [Atlantibacter sp.]|uniref:fimbrial protein n=1 Tax=Atlantibacter sp. TaxID=1903473 RepID=UPI0028AAA358|nr:fimbrial protein [Atlantibacter sp.]
MEAHALILRFENSDEINKMKISILGRYYQNIVSYILLSLLSTLSMINMASAYLDIPIAGAWGNYQAVSEACPDILYQGLDYTTYLFKIYRPVGYECYQYHPAGYPPHSGEYRLRERIYYLGAVALENTSEPFYLDATKTVDQNSVRIETQTTTASAPEVNVSQQMFMCAWLVDESGTEYSTASSSYCRDQGGEPLPPTPPAPDISCTFNNSNDLTVRLGTIDRAELPILPDSAAAKSVQIPVECTGGDVTVSMKLNYNPMALGSSQAVKTTANGVGVAISYNDIPISTTDTTTLNFLEGSNTLDLDFQAVRDSAVNVADIPTGGFTASAAVVMTQQ